MRDSGSGEGISYFLTVNLLPDRDALVDEVEIGGFLIHSG